MSPRVRRARRWLIAAAVAAYLPILGAPLRGWWDFAAFWAAARLVPGPELLDPGEVVEFQAGLGLPPTPFVYPPGLALPYLPLAALPYQLAAALHASLMVVTLIAAAAVWAPLLAIPRRWAVLGALAWGPAAASVVSGQNATVVLLLAGLAARWLEHSGRAGARAGQAGVQAGRAGALAALAAGSAAGLAGYKPHLGWPVAVGSLLGGRSRAVWPAILVGLAAAAALHYVAGVLATGGDIGWPAAWLDAVRAYSGADLEANGWQAISGPAIGARFGQSSGSGVPLTVGWLAGLALAGLALVRLRRSARSRGAAEAIALALAIGLLVNPHAWVYDATVLLPALGIVAADAARRGWPQVATLPIVLAFAAGSTWAFGGFIGLTALPLVAAWLPLAALEARPTTQVRAGATA